MRKHIQIGILQLVFLFAIGKAVAQEEPKIIKIIQAGGSTQDQFNFPGANILVKKEGETYAFKVVDINRMKFGVLSQDERMKNFSKLWAKDKDLTVMIEAYAQEADLNKEELVQKALYLNQKHKDRINMKKRARGIEVVD